MFKKLAGKAKEIVSPSVTAGLSVTEERKKPPSANAKSILKAALLLQQQEYVLPISHY